MQKIKTKPLLLLLSSVMLMTYYEAGASCLQKGNHPIEINEVQVQSTPKGSIIQASIDGHYLSVTFTQNIGNVTMELDMASGPMLFNYPSVQTPDSYQFYLNQTGDYIITFSLANGDEYYGEFTITD